MTTIELEPLTEGWVDERDADAPRECHLYRVGAGTSMCGRVGNIHNPVVWETGRTSCPVCGCPICVDCLLIAS